MAHPSRLSAILAPFLLICGTGCDRQEAPTSPRTAAAVTAEACGARPNNSESKLLECISLEAVRAHQAALQAIADANGANRASGTSGHELSAAYVADLMEAAGYRVTVQDFSYLNYLELTPTVLLQIAPVSVSYARNVDYAVMTESPSADVTAPVAAVDLTLGLGNSATSGCEASDFAGFPAGSIALMQRGVCNFDVKAENAAAAGAVGAIIFNQGNTADRIPLFHGTLGSDYTGGIPVVSASYEKGAEWSVTAGLVMRIAVDAFSGAVESRNVIAETTTGDPGNVVVVGGHLDSTPDGPGIQDNGSGSAALLEVALQLARVRPRNQVRFAWWGAGEAGMAGSRAYAEGLSSTDLGAIALYLSADQIAAPNFVYFVLDGDGSESGAPGADGSAAIESFLRSGYSATGEVTAESSEPSDWTPFFDAGVPYGGITTGSTGIKTSAEAATWGGVAGVQYDPCYHLACDTFDNNSLEALELNSGILARAVLTFAMSTELVNGARGKGNFKQRPAAPAPTGVASF